MYLSSAWLTSLMFLLGFVLAQQHFWNRKIYLWGQLESYDYTQSSFGGKDVERGSFSLEILSNNTFIFKIDFLQNISPIAITGQVSFDDRLSFISGEYRLVTTQSFSGFANYEIGFGVNWKYSFKLANQHINIRRTQIKYSHLSWILLVIFAAVGLILIPIADQQRNKLLYNLKKRTHTLTLMIIVIKIISVLSCFITIAYQSIIILPFWLILVVYGIYIFFLAPSIIHSLYLLTSLQKSMNQFQALSKTTKNKLILAVFFSTFLLSVLLLFIQKGIMFYYIFSLANVAMYVHACRIKKYVYGQLILYDASLTAVQTIISLFLPVMNYTIISFKQAILFWNYYIFLFLFGLLLMKKLIRFEKSEQVQISQNQVDNPHGEMSMNQSINKPQSIQIIQ